jgi:hypothetical protein
MEKSWSKDIVLFITWFYELPIPNFDFTSYISLTSSNNQFSEFRIPNIYNEILFILFFAWSKVGPTVSSAIYNPL